MPSEQPSEQPDSYFPILIIRVLEKEKPFLLVNTPNELPRGEAIKVCALNADETHLKVAQMAFQHGVMQTMYNQEE